jgi:transcriptional regulator with XRE-family HTH domain
MNFGEKLRQLRLDRKLTQPELAEAMGIEQSYLSKLENCKSLPSGDVLHRMLDVFDLDVGTLVDDLDQGVRNQLRQIPYVADHFNRQKQLIIGNRRRWLLVSAALFSVGAALVYGGSVRLFASDVVYQYVSHGIVRDGESKEIFQILSSPTRNPFRQLSPSGHASLKSRTDEEFLQTRDFRGNVFNIPVDGGSRTFYLEDRNQIDAWENKAAASAGILMMALGLIGIVLEKKLSRYQ